MQIHCFKCGKEFIPSKFNTKILGPYVEVQCPFCSDVYEGKLLSYVTDLIGGWRSQSHSDAANMQALARLVELSSSEYYEKKGLRHGKKKVRNV